MDPTDLAGAVAVLLRGQHRAGAAAIAAGHADYPTFRHLFPDPRRRARALRAFFSATVRDAIPLGAALAVWRPEYQRRGLGSRLVRPILDRADRDGVACHLETADPANVPYYRRFGFEVIDPALEVIPGGPTLTMMRRPPG